MEDSQSPEAPVKSGLKAAKSPEPSTCTEMMTLVNRGYLVLLLLRRARVSGDKFSSGVLCSSS